MLIILAVYVGYTFFFIEWRLMFYGRSKGSWEDDELSGN
jgi:hypothetical protein